jgi:hypothetical protein
LVSESTPTPPHAHTSAAAKGTAAASKVLLTLVNTLPLLVLKTTG